MRSLLRIPLLMVLAIMLVATAALTAGCAAEDSAGDDALSGETVVQEKCTTCHEITVVEQQPSDVDWDGMIDRMINEYDAEISEAEKAAAIEYLSNR